MFSRVFQNAPHRRATSISQRLFSTQKKSILQRLRDGVVIGDGGFVFALEKRGYVKAGPWTPEATVEFPDAVKQLHREFARAGSDVMQTFTFYASEDKLENRGNYAAESYGTDDINRSACRIAHEVADEYGALVAGGICQTPTYLSNIGKDETKKQFAKQCRVFKEENVDFMIVEYYEHIEECCWAIETVKEEMPGIAIAANLCINYEGDLHDVSCGECAIKMAEMGANIIGVNCHFDPFVTLKTIEEMKNALDKKGYLYDGDNDKNKDGVFLMTQPIAYMTPDANKQGFIDLPEFPFALEPRLCTRWDMHKYAREAYDLGVRYIGGCCGFEPYHIRAVAEELENERNGVIGDSSLKHERWGGGLKMHTKPWVRERGHRAYWENIEPASGRPHCSSLSRPDAWGVTQGHDKLKQKKEI